MAGVAIQFHPNAFDAGKPLYSFAGSKERARWTLSGHTESQPDVEAHISHDEYGHLPVTPYHAIVINYGSPTTFDTTEEFNKLPYSEYRAAIANAVNVRLSIGCLKFP